MGALALYLDLMLDLLSLSLFSNGNQKSKRPVDAESILKVYRTDLCGTDGVREEVGVRDATHIKQTKK